MGLNTIILKTGAVPTTAPAASPSLAPVYQPATGTAKKAAIIKSMRFTNTGGDLVKLRGWFRKTGEAMTTETDGRRIFPYDFAIPAGYTAIEEAELTLDSGEGVYFYRSAGTGAVHFVLCGVEQDVS